MGTFAARQNRASLPRPTAPARPTILTTTGPDRGERSVVDLERTSETQAAQHMLQGPADALGAGRNSATHPTFRLDFSQIHIHRPSARARERKAEVFQRKESELEDDSSVSGDMKLAQERLALAEQGVSGQGVSIPAPLRTPMEAQFGSSFAKVRLHTDASAVDATRRLGAAAYALGHDIAFGQGFYAPHTSDGLCLLAHELTHVVQSQGAAARPLRAGEAAVPIAPLEREAERASVALSWGRIDVRERLAGRLALCHPVFISGHNIAKDGFQAKFFQAWGYTPIKTGVMSIEEILKGLATQSSVEHISIVSHANEIFLMMQFLDGGPEQIFKNDWDVQTVSDLVNLEQHVVVASTVDDIIKRVQQKNAALLNRIGPITDAFVRQFIWWVIEQVQADKAGWTFILSNKMKQSAKDHADQYRDRLIAVSKQAGAGSGQMPLTATDFTNVEQAVVAEANTFQWKQVSPPTVDVQRQHMERVKESPSQSINRVAANPEFFKNLKAVQSKVSDSSWIEILGCNAGKDSGYLTAIQKFFAGATGKKPKVTGPDWMQFFGHYGFTAIPDSEKEAELRWNAKDGIVRAAFGYWYPIITGSKLPAKPNHLTLLKYLRKRHALPLAIPGAIGMGNVLLLRDVSRDAFLGWLSLHSYRLTAAADIQKTMFQSSDLGKDIEGAPIDWLQEKLSGPTKIIFRPSPEYAKHIIKAP